jgi:hypothetical protein
MYVVLELPEARQWTDYSVEFRINNNYYGAGVLLRFQVRWCCSDVYAQCACSCVCVCVRVRVWACRRAYARVCVRACTLDAMPRGRYVYLQDKNNYYKWSTMYDNCHGISKLVNGVGAYLSDSVGFVRFSLSSRTAATCVTETGTNLRRDGGTPIKRYTWLNVRIDIFGPNIDVFVENALVMSVVDATPGPTNGTIAFWTAHDMYTYFDGLRVRGVRVCPRAPSCHRFRRVYFTTPAAPCLALQVYDRRDLNTTMLNRNLNNISMGSIALNDYGKRPESFQSQVRACTRCVGCVCACVHVVTPACEHRSLCSRVWRGQRSVDGRNRASCRRPTEACSHRCTATVPATSSARCRAAARRTASTAPCPCPRGSTATGSASPCLRTR